MKKLSVIVLHTALLAGLAASALAQPADHAAPDPAKPQPEKKQDGEKAAQGKRIGDPYPLAVCPVTGEKLGSMGDPVVKLYEGREVRFCCKSCPPKFEKDLPKSLAALDEAVIKEQAPNYPLKTSVVTGKALPDKPFDFVHGNRLIRLGAEAEKAEFLKQAEKHLKALDKAVVEAQGKDYPLKTCPVSGEKLGSMGQPIDMVVAGRLVRLCCGGCKKDLLKDPMKYIAAVDAAGKAEKPAEDKKEPGR